jgi:hypothetical protein
MKKFEHFQVNYHQNHALLSAIKEKFDELGFDTKAKGFEFSEEYPFAVTGSDSDFPRFAFTYDSDWREDLSLDEFFSLKKEDINPEPPAKEMTVEQAAKAFGNHKLEELLQEQLGYKIKIVES